MKLRQITTLLFLGFSFSCYSVGKILQVSDLFSNGAVLQRNDLVNIWGKASPNEDIKVISEWGKELILKSNPDGNWSGGLQTPEAGGPFFIEIYSRNEKIKIKDILIGEVWLASGQSNMEMPIKGYPPNDTILDWESEVLNADYPTIRMFNVERNIATEPSKNLNGSWVQASSNQVENFSSTAYFFARELHKNLKIPIGIIHSSWGGSPAESWTSENKLRDLGFFIDTLDIINKNMTEDTIANWFKKFDSIDIPKEEYPGDKMESQYKLIEFSEYDLSKMELDDLDWGKAKLPGRFDNLISTNFDGAFWFRKEILINDTTSDYTLNIGYIDDMDKTYINGHYIGGLSGYGVWNQKREFLVKKSILKKGKNIIAIRAIDTGGPGYFQGPMNLSNQMNEIVSIEGDWKYKPIAEIYERKFYVYDEEVSFLERPNIIKLSPFLPEVLFNGMINPLIPFSLKGVIWYQGESNVGRDKQYMHLFPGMIEDWRKNWGEEFPFYFVQIAPFRYNRTPGIDDVSQELREAQRKTLKLPKTGMAVTLDIGDYDNIHPSNKQDVGKRLARLALVNDYNVGLSPMGPILKNSELFDSSIRLEFVHTGTGLLYIDNQKKQFQIASANLQFFDANVILNGDYLIVSSEFVNSPKYVKYAWSDTPEATLFNSEAFPASSFMIEVK